jgi:membrane associated rhomboid family serine protease
MHGDTLTLLLCIIIGFTTWQGLNRPGVMERYLFSTELFRMRREWVRLVSPAFLHGSWGHFAGNAITLFFFGRGLENALGPGVLLGTFFVSVAGGHGLCLLLHKHGDYRAIGASGGALGILFSTILLFPGMTIMMFPLPIPIPAWLYALGFLAYTLSSMRGGSGVSHEAHLGGMLTGVLITLLQHPSLFLSQPLLILLILGTSSIGIWYFHVNPGRVPGFFRMVLRDQKNKQRSTTARRNSQTVDDLLDKVSREGLHSLSKWEREILENASKQRRGRG